ncbi:MAG: beta-galactosidase [Anaerolineae bacterium]|nr:beta-galactosidase [Anaerolineae bacterium]
MIYRPHNWPPLHIALTAAIRWGLRIGLIVLLLGLLRPTPPRAVLGPPQTVATTQPLLCMHTRLVDEVDEWKIQRSLVMVRELGADTIVEFFPWAYFEPDPGVFSWGQADRIFTHAENQGLRVIARLGMVPAWARPDPASVSLLGGVQGDHTTLNHLDEAHYADFARYVGAFVARYGDVLDGVIIWNEPNLAFEWGYREVSPAEYTDVLRLSYAAAKAARPDVLVLGAPLAPTLEPEGSPWGMNDLTYLERMYEAGAAAYFDALAVHTYGFTEPAEAAPAPDVLNFRRIELVQAIMARFGDAEKPIYVTETGWNDHPRWTKAVRPVERIAYTLGSYEWTAANLPTVEKLCQWVLRYPAPTNSYPDNFTFLTADFRPRPIYEVLQAYARGEEVVLP